MGMYEWAERECRIACKKENPNYDFDSDEFDYSCSCYKSALKAYKSLCEDDHSGTSFNFTKHILIALMEGQALTPITDEDFFSPEMPDTMLGEGSNFLAMRGLKSDLQCPRMYSLFREETLDGKVTYHDNDRAYYIDVEHPSDMFSSNTDVLDEMFPITMPYKPKKGKYKIYCQTFLTNEKHGDFDTKGILYVITPENEKIDVGIYMTEDEEGKMKRITKEEYDKLLERRIDRIFIKTADHLLWTLLSNSSNEETTENRKKAYKALTDTRKDYFRYKLMRLCLFFEKPENWQYNTFGMQQALCRGDEEEYKDIPELVEIAKHLHDILEEIE